MPKRPVLIAGGKHRARIDTEPPASPVVTLNPCRGGEYASDSV